MNIPWTNSSFKVFGDWAVNLTNSQWSKWWTISRTPEACELSLTACQVWCTASSLLWSEIQLPRGYSNYLKFCKIVATIACTDLVTFGCSFVVLDCSQNSWFQVSAAFFVVLINRFLLSISMFLNIGYHHCVFLSKYFFSSSELTWILHQCSLML